MNKKFNKLILFLSANSVLFSACSSLEDNGNSPFTAAKDFSSEHFSSNNTDACGLTSLRSLISLEENEEIQGLIQLSKDLIDSEDLQKDFLDDYSKVAHSYGIKSIDISPKTTTGSILRSYTDPKALELLKQKDIRGYMDYLASQNISLRTSFTSQELAVIPLKSGSYNNEAQYFPIVPIVFLIYAGVATIVAFEIVATAHFAVDVGFAGIDHTDNGDLDSDTEMIGDAIDELVENGVISENDREDIEEKILGLISDDKQQNNERN